MPLAKSPLGRNGHCDGSGGVPRSHSPGARSALFRREGRCSLRLPGTLWGPLPGWAAQLSKTEAPFATATLCREGAPGALGASRASSGSEVVLDAHSEQACGAWR